MVELFEVNNWIPEESEKEWAAKLIGYNHSGGPLGMQVEHLQRWIVETQRMVKPDTKKWLKVVDLVQTAFCDSLLTE